MGKEAAVCLGCSKKFTGKEYSIQCTVCGLWIHKACSGISDEGFKFISEQRKNAGASGLFWSCRPCTSYAQGMNHRLKQMEDRISKTETDLKETNTRVDMTEKKTDKISNKVEKIDEKIQQMAKEQEDDIFDEIRERDTRKMNLVFHGVGEHEDDRATGSARIEWDRKSCHNIFKALEVRMDEDDIKFCRRVGERGNGPRPLIVGFYSEQEKNSVARKAKRLEETNYKEVSIVPDLTRRQRQEEGSMFAEAERRNECELTESDTAKNLQWRVVGPKGERRLIKTQARDQPSRGTGHRGHRGAPRGRLAGVGAGRGREERRQTFGRNREEQNRGRKQPVRLAADNNSGSEDTEEEEMEVTENVTKGKPSSRGRDTRGRGTGRARGAVRGPINAAMGTRVQRGKDQTEDQETNSGAESTEEDEQEGERAGTQRKRKERNSGEEEVEEEGPPEKR